MHCLVATNHDTQGLPPSTTQADPSFRGTSQPERLELFFSEHPQVDLKLGDTTVIQVQRHKQTCSEERG